MLWQNCRHPGKSQPITAPSSRHTPTAGTLGSWGLSLFLCPADKGKGFHGKQPPPKRPPRPSPSTRAAASDSTPARQISRSDIETASLPLRRVGLKPYRIYRSEPALPFLIPALAFSVALFKQIIGLPLSNNFLLLSLFKQMWEVWLISHGFFL